MKLNVSQIRQFLDALQQVYPDTIPLDLVKLV